MNRVGNVLSLLILRRKQPPCPPLTKSLAADCSRIEPRGTVIFLVCSGYALHELYSLVLGDKQIDQSRRGRISLDDNGHPCQMEQHPSDGIDRQKLRNLGRCELAFSKFKRNGSALDFRKLLMMLVVPSKAFFSCSTYGDDGTQNLHSHVIETYTRFVIHETYDHSVDETMKHIQSSLIKVSQFHHGSSQ